MEKIKDHKFQHGCMKDCKLDHSQNCCQAFINPSSYKHCGKLESEHEELEKYQVIT